MTENVRVTKQLKQYLAVGNERCWVRQVDVLDKAMDGNKLLRITVEEVELLPEVKVGQVWSDRGMSCVVVKVDNGVISYFADGEYPMYRRKIEDWNEEFTLIQDVCEVNP
jgi:hypothetical protein